MSSSDEELIGFLHSKGFKVTHQRLAIFKYLSNNDSHPTAETIYEAMKKILPTISQGTVYKTLSMLTEIGILHELNYINAPTRYDINTSFHINVICTQCGTIVDHESERVEKLWNQISNELGGNITGQRFDVYQNCGNCSNVSEKGLN
ncbi:MAG: Fur family transcriptional regulator [Candidatus Kariarchaeaceae archaeon]|jgi:Fur family peroxide stress response transcriptional regulator